MTGGEHWGKDGSVGVGLARGKGRRCGGKREEEGLGMSRSLAESPSPCWFGRVRRSLGALREGTIWQGAGVEPPTPRRGAVALGGFAGTGILVGWSWQSSGHWGRHRMGMGRFVRGPARSWGDSYRCSIRQFGPGE